MSTAFNVDIDKTALMTAFSRRSVDLEAGDDIDKIDPEAILLEAIAYRDFDSVKILLDAGVSPNARDDDGKTALMYAIMSEVPSEYDYCNINIVKLLLDRGAEVTPQDNKGQTALMYAVKNCVDSDIFKSFKESINLHDNDGCTALMYAARMGLFPFVEELIDIGADVDLRDNCGCTALMHTFMNRWAMGQELVFTMNALIEAGAEIDAQDNYGKTALMYASSLMHGVSNTTIPEVIKTFISAGAESLPRKGMSLAGYVNAKDCNGMTALMHAVTNECVRTVRALIDVGAKVDLQDELGITALMYAANADLTMPKDYYVDIADALIKAGADINIQNDYGTSALMLASVSLRPDMVQLLIDAGANINAKNAYDKTALKAAQEKYAETEDPNHAFIMNLLLEQQLLQERGLETESDCDTFER